MPTLLQDWAERAPDAPAILAPGRAPLRYGRLYEHIGNVAGALQAMGLTRNDRIALVLPNGPEVAVAFLAAAAGTTCAPLNPAFSSIEFANYLTDLHAKALIVQAGVDSPARIVAQERGINIVELSPALSAEAGLFTLTGEQQTGADHQKFASPEDVALVLPTSGTTSQPKIVSLSHINVCTAAHNMRLTLELAAGDRCLNVLPFFHAHALLAAFLTSLITGASIVCPPDFSAPIFFACMAAFRPTWYTAVPTIHQAILSQAARHRETITRCPLRFIRSASAPLPPQVLTELERVFNVPVLETYGTTETSAQIASNPLPPRARKLGSVGIAAGPEIAIVDEGGTNLPTSAIGEIIVRGATVFQGYENNPEANSHAFMDDWFRTGDQGYLDADGYLFVTGRLKEIINRGGEKIMPREVDEALMDHPAVAQAVTFAVPHARLGEEVAAAVVLRQSAAATASDIRRFAATRLAAFKVPHRVLIVEDLPKSPTGKLQRLGLAEKFGLATPNPAQSTMQVEDITPRTPVEEVLAGLWAQVLEVERVGIHDDFFQLGGDSILATQLISRVRDTMHVELSFLSFFESPTVADMARSVETVIRAAWDLPSPPLRSVPRNRALPLSYPQQRLWFLSQLGLSSPAYNLLEVMHLHGSLQVAALEQSLQEILRRHETLRTTYADVEGQPVQIVGPIMNIPLRMVDLQELPKSERETRIRMLAREEAQRPFDLARGPLVRISLLCLASEEHVLLITMHHIIFDGWSHRIFWQELTVLYEAFVYGGPSPLPELPIQYADFAIWQRQWLQNGVLEAQLAYWKQQFCSDIPILELPISRPRPVVQTFRGARQSLVLSKSLTEELKLLSQQEGVTVFMLLLAAFKTLLYRYTGQEEVIVGSVIANRTRVELENLIGFFANTLVLRTNLSGNPSFRQLLGRVREVCLGAYAHQDLPFEKLVEVLQPERNLSHNPLFQVMFILQNAPRRALEVPGLRLRPMEVDSGTAKFDLILAMMDTEEGLRGEVEYQIDLFDADAITRMLGHFQTLLRSIATNPDQRLSDLSLLTETERRLLATAQNTIKADLTKNICVHQLFETQAARTPDAVAVVFEHQRITYRELNRRANQLAYHLRKLGVGPEKLVGICMQRSLDMIVALLGILKAGGAFVAFDPACPKERLAFMLEDTQAAVLLTQARLVERLPASELEVICLDADREAMDEAYEENPACGVMAENLAYVIYTSGSTGQPKGVLISHGAIANHCLDIQQHYQLTSSDRVLQFASLNFDASLEQIFGALIAGAKLVLREKDVWVAADLQEMALDYGLTVINVPPAYWHQWALEWASAPEQVSQQIRLVIIGGDVMQPETLHLWWQTPMKAVRLLNAYGPTETVITATTFEVPSGSSELLSFRRIPIGRPQANRQVYILDHYGHLVPIGVPGELHIGGAGLARGYLNQPELTAEKFIPHPFCDEPGTRLYKTGDLARYLPDGNLEYLGRLDHQVKVRGFRIELSEIEAVLRQHPAVRQTVVLAREDMPGDPRLVAYVVPTQEPVPTTSQLRTFLQKKLPEYMVPSAFVFLEGLPLTPSGKVDRRALPSPDYSARPELVATFVAPRTPVEEGLASIWADILGVNQVGIHDNFFELGGHSLLATRVISRICRTFQVELPLRPLFEAPTVADLAMIVAQCQAERVEEDNLVRILAEVEGVSEEEVQRRLADGRASD